MKNNLFLAFAIILLMASCSNSSDKNIQQDTISLDSIIDKNEEPVNSHKGADNSIYFRATGTEPFWGLDISKGRIVLDMMGDSIVAIPETNNASNASNTFQINNDSLSLKIQLISEECTNGMSGKISPYTVVINFKRKSDKQERSLEGCGDYLTDKKLTSNNRFQRPGRF